MPDYREIYRTQAREYDLLVSREDVQGNILRTLDHIQPIAGLDVVEFGAGTGRLTRLLAPVARSILAFDISPHMLGTAIPRLAASRARNWRVVAADNRCLPLADGSADIAIAGWTFGHFTSWYAGAWRHEIGRCLAQMKRLLRPGGVAIVLETLGTGWAEPHPPNEAHATYYRWLEDENGFSATWIRTDLKFTSIDEAETLIRFFFGDELADRIVREHLIELPECTGIWWLKGE